MLAKIKMFNIADSKSSCEKDGHTILFRITAKYLSLFNSKSIEI